MKFKEMPLSSAMKRALSELGYQSPLPVQALTLPLIQEGKDLIVSARTGSGKTAAYGIPLLESLDYTSDAIQAVVLVPTRELADQVLEEMMDLGRYHGLRCLALYGKQPIEIQRKAIKSRPHLIVATPGRLMDHLEKRNIKLNATSFFVLDEADELMLMGFEPQLDAILKKIPKKDERVCLLFSATIPQEVIYLSERFQDNAERIDLVEEAVKHENIDQLYYAVDGLKKVDFLREMLRRERPTKAIVFCNTQDQVQRLFPILKKDSLKAGMLHGGMEQAARKDVIKAFKRGEIKLLVSTDLGGRGLHIDGISHVVNYSMPFEHEQYVHRIGRTGRVAESGVAITLVIPAEMDRFNALQRYLSYDIPCRGGHIQRQRKNATEEAQKSKRYKATHSKHTPKIRLLGGRSENIVRNSDIISAIRSIAGMSAGDVGKIQIFDHYTLVEILNGKEAIALKGLKEKRINGKLFRVKREA